MLPFSPIASATVFIPSIVSAIKVNSAAPGFTATDRKYLAMERDFVRRYVEKIAR